MEDTNSLVEQFLANGGQITKCPYRAPTQKRSLKDSEKPSPPKTAFSPKAECEKLLETVNAKRARIGDKPLTKEDLEEANSEKLPWE